jgi:peptide-methionine (S)-S-oxide reductase
MTSTTMDDAVPAGLAVATLAGGCFWCTEAVFLRVKGVKRVVSGYTAGHTDAPTYREVCEGDTGHAEAVRIEFDPTQVRYEDLLDVFFATHDPTTRNRQGNDVGTQYRSAIFFHDDAQRRIAIATIEALDRARIWPDPVVTEIAPATRFWPAEAFHHDYFSRNGGQPYCRFVVAPKVAKFDEKFGTTLGRADAFSG